MPSTAAQQRATAEQQKRLAAQERASHQPFGPLRPSEVARLGSRIAIQRQQERHAQARAHAFRPSPSAGLEYERALRKLAREIAAGIKRHFGMPPLSPDQQARLDEFAAQYADQIEPWAQRVARKMLGQTNHANVRAWQQHMQEVSGEIGERLQQELISAPVGETFEALMGDGIGIYSWDDPPPVTDPPAYRAWPGCIWNCRCLALPVITG
jgi:hypothetical protein